MNLCGGGGAITALNVPLALHDKTALMTLYVDSVCLVESLTVDALDEQQLSFLRLAESVGVWRADNADRLLAYLVRYLHLHDGHMPHLRQLAVGARTRPPQLA